MRPVRFDIEYNRRSRFLIRGLNEPVERSVTWLYSGRPAMLCNSFFISATVSVCFGSSARL